VSRVRLNLGEASHDLEGPVPPPRPQCGTVTGVATGRSLRGAVALLAAQQYNTMQYKICKAPCCRGFRGATLQVATSFILRGYRRVAPSRGSTICYTAAAAAAAAAWTGQSHTISRCEHRSDACPGAPVHAALLPKAR